MTFTLVSLLTKTPNLLWTFSSAPARQSRRPRSISRLKELESRAFSDSPYWTQRVMRCIRHISWRSIRAGVIVSFGAAADRTFALTVIQTERFKPYWLRGSLRAFLLAATVGSACLVTHGRGRPDRDCPQQYRCLYVSGRCGRCYVRMDRSAGTLANCTSPSFAWWCAQLLLLCACHSV